MGNHNVGYAMEAAARVFWLMAPPSPTKGMALAALEMAGAPWRGQDAEFSGYLGADQPLGKLIGLAFDATLMEIEDSLHGEGDLWYEGPETRFGKHFGFS